MTEEMENLDSQNEDGGAAEPETDAAAEDSHEELSDREKQFLARAKKAEAKLKELKAHKVEAPAEPKTEVKETKTNDLDYGQKAYLKAYGIAGSDELALVREYLTTGKSIDEIVENKHFNNDLGDLREVKATKEATPSATKRGAPSGTTSVEYWLAKGELPPADNVQLRRDVLNARIEREKQRSKFSDQPVISH
jgi:hypothetical protein